MAFCNWKIILAQWFGMLAMVFFFLITKQTSLPNHNFLIKGFASTLGF